MSVAEESADTAIDERRSLWIGDIAQCVGPVLLIVRKPRVSGSTDIAGGEIGEQRVFAGPAVTVTLVAFVLAAEEVVAGLLLRRELRLLREHRVELRGKRRHLGRGFIAGDGLRHLVEGGADPAAIDRAQMNRQRLAGGRRPGPVADLLHVFGPSDRERLR